MDEPAFDLIVRAGRVCLRRYGFGRSRGRRDLRGPYRGSGAGRRWDGSKDSRLSEWGVLLPGLVDLHTHPAPSDWKYGIDPDVEILPRGATDDSLAGRLRGG